MHGHIIRLGMLRDALKFLLVIFKIEYIDQLADKQVFSFDSVARVSLLPGKNRLAKAGRHCNFNCVALDNVAQQHKHKPKRTIIVFVIPTKTLSSASMNVQNDPLPLMSFLNYTMYAGFPPFMVGTKDTCCWATN